MPDDVMIVGGGISGLSALHFIRRRFPDHAVSLYEAEPRLGGVIGVDRVQGYLCEWGPSALRDRDGMASALCAELGMEDELRPAAKNARSRYILRGGKLRPVPMSPGALLAPGAISMRGKLRALLEPFAGIPDGEDESIYQFAERRLGSEIADYLVQPLVTGIFAGDARELSFRSCFPALFEMEREGGSLFRGALAKRKAKKKEQAAPEANNSEQKPSVGIATLSGGVYRLIEALRNKHQESIHTEAKVESLTKTSEGYRASFESGESAYARQIIVALPAHSASVALRSLAGELAETLLQIRYAPVAVACLGYDRQAIAHDICGFGYLVPRKEKANHLGSIWVSSIFPDQAPPGKALLRVLMGGTGAENTLNRSDENLMELADSETSRLLGIREKPEMSRLFRWIHAVPQYRVGHHELLEKIENELARLPGLHLAGNAYTGVGVVDCIKRSANIAEMI